MKFVDVDAFIEEHENTQTETFDLLRALKDAPAADVIPVAFIDSWFAEHYGMHYNPIAKDWKT